MSSPIINLRKTNMAPEKVINVYNGTQIKNNPRSIEEEVKDIRRNSYNEVSKEKYQMSHKMSNLEILVKDAKEELSKALELINRKDEEIEMLKGQLSQQRKQQTHSNLSISEDVGQEDEYLTEQYDKLNDIMNDMSPKKARKFFRKGDVISSDDGNCEEKRKYCEGLANQRKTSKGYCQHEETDEDLSINSQLKRKKSKKMYEDDISSEDENLDLKKLLAERVDEYLNKYSSTNSVSSQNNSQELEEEFSRLAGQVTEMERFLADYGLIWVGEKKVTDEKHGDRIIQTSIGFTPNFDKVVMIIGELNERISSENQIKVTGNQGRFQKADMVNLTLYHDGMQLEDKPFRKYSAQSVKEFFQDLEDGYFPAELKESYPEGVVFKISDKRSMEYADAKKQESLFSGPGYRLGALESSDEEPDAKQKRARRKPRAKEEQAKRESDAKEEQAKREPDAEEEQTKNGQNTTNLKDEMAPDDKHISISQKYSHEDGSNAVDENNRDDLQNRTDGREGSEGKMGTIVTEPPKVITDQAPESTKSKEDKLTQTEMVQETHNVRRRSLETQTNGSEVSIRNDIGTRKALYRDMIEITNITYHEAPSSTPGMTRHVVIGPLASHSEPVISSSVSMGNYQAESRGAYRKHALKEGDSKQTRRGRETYDAISEGSEDSNNKNFMATEYESRYNRNAGEVAAMLDQKSKRPVITPTIDLTQHYEHMVILGSNMTLSEEVKTDKSERTGSTPQVDPEKQSNKSMESVEEPKVTSLNNRTSDGQIELNLKSYDGKEIYSGYLYPDDTIGKIWSLTHLNPDEFEVAVDDKVLDMNVPLKNYNIVGDVTLNIVKKKLSYKLDSQEKKKSSYKLDSQEKKKSSYKLDSQVKKKSSSKLGSQNTISVKNKSNEDESDSTDDNPPEISTPDDEEGYSS